MTRPALPRASSAMSGFFFCGSIDEPVVYASASRRNPNSSVVHSTISSPSRERCTCASASHEQRFGHEVAVGHRVERVVEPAREAEVGGHAVGIERAGSSRRARRRRAATRRRAPSASRQRSTSRREGPEVREQVVREQHRLRALQVRVARAGRRRPAVDGALEQHLLELVDRAAATVDALAAHVEPQRRWRPGRCGCGRCGASRRPSPASSVTRRSIAVWMSSSVGCEHERSLGELSCHRVERREHDRALVRGEQPHPCQHAHVRARARRCRRPRAAVERQALGERAAARRPGPSANRPCQSGLAHELRCSAGSERRRARRVLGHGPALLGGPTSRPTRPHSRTKPGRVLVAERCRRRRTWRARSCRAPARRARPADEAASRLQRAGAPRR